jgi:hypothetical protein
MRIGRRRLVLSVAAFAGAAPAVAAPLRLERPRTAIALLLNLKRAADEGLLLDEAFYAEANLKEAFAAAQVTFGRPIDGYRLYGRVSGFGVLFEAARVGGSYREGVEFGFSLSSPDATPVEGRLQLSFPRPTLAFDDVEKAFGTDWKPAPYPVAPDAAPPHAERVHGGSAIAYRAMNGNPARWITFAFNPRALLELAIAVAQ